MLKSENFIIFVQDDNAGFSGFDSELCAGTEAGLLQHIGDMVLMTPGETFNLSDISIFENPPVT